MKIAMVGTGYVGLVTGTCFADSGNDVTCVDIDELKIESLNRGEVPIFEPGLAELVERNIGAGRLHFTTDLCGAVQPARLIFLAVGTPSMADGSADLTSLWKVIEDVAGHLADNAIVVTKSTVPVGTNARIHARLRELTGRDCHVASNPEFLKEGRALDDFEQPDRVVVGVRDQEVADVLQKLYEPFLLTKKPFVVMSPESAEMTKYVANAFLATKISFINEMANLCERTGADVNDVREGIGHDARIGFKFLFPGVGYGGSCFPKDVRALAKMAREAGMAAHILHALDYVNANQKRVLLDRIVGHFGGKLRGKRIAVWGLSFKPRTDDIREAPSLCLIDGLLSHGCRLAVHDPEAMENVRKEYRDRLNYADTPMEALPDADALAIVTEWPQFRNPDFEAMRKAMNCPLVFDGRNLFDLGQMQSAGFTYYSIGRATVNAPAKN